MSHEHETAEKIIRMYEGKAVHPLLLAHFHDGLLRNLKPKTTKCNAEREHYLMQYLKSRELDIDDVTRQVVSEYILELKSKVSIATINGRLRVYKRWFRVLIEEELWEKPNPMHGIKMLREPKKVRSVIGPDEVNKMLSTLKKKNYYDNRNRLALILHWDNLLRSGEIRNLKIGNIDISKRLMTVDGKTGERTLPLSIKTAKAISLFLLKWRKDIPGDYLICLADGRKLTEHRYHHMIKNIAIKAGVDVTPHGLRHASATHYSKLPGCSIEQLRILLGHSSLATTQIYLHLSAADMVDSYSTLSPGTAIKY